MKSVTANQVVMWVALAVLSAALLVEEPDPSSGDKMTGVDYRIQTLEHSVQTLLQSSQHIQPRQEQSDDAAHVDMVERVASIEQMLDLLQDRIADLKDPGEASEIFAADVPDQQLFENLVARAGLAAAGATPQAFAPDTPDISTVGASLVDTFAASALGQHSQLAAANCEATTCSLELVFPDAQSAVENELLMMSWLAAVDPACGMRFDAVEPGNQQQAARRIEIECG